MFLCYSTSHTQNSPSIVHHQQVSETTLQSLKYIKIGENELQKYRKYDSKRDAPFSINQFSFLLIYSSFVREWAAHKENSTCLELWSGTVTHYFTIDQQYIRKAVLVLYYGVVLIG